MVDMEISPFDYIDEFEVLNRFTIQGLRKEIASAEMNLFLFENTVNYPEFPYRAWLNLCRRCLNQLKQATPEQLKSAFTGKVDLDELKAKNDIIDIASRFTDLVKSGSYRYKGKCPVHPDKTPSFMVYADKQTWHCFGCNKGGDVIALVMAAENVDFKMALEKLK